MERIGIYLQRPWNNLRKTGNYVACVRGVDGPEGRRQAYRGELSTANAQPRMVGLDFHAKQDA